MKKFIFFSMLTIWTVSAQAEDHLVPEDNQFTGLFMPQYYERVIYALEEAYNDNVLARALVFPSFQPEYALGIRSKGESYEVFKVSPELKLWGYESIAMMKDGTIKTYKDGVRVTDDNQLQEMESRYPESFKDIKLLKCSTDLPNELALQILSVWEAMLLETRYRKSNRVGMDGTTYHYSMTVGFQDFAGKVWSPDEQSNTGLFVALTHTLGSYCQHSESSDLQRAKELADEVQSRLNEEL